MWTYCQQYDIKIPRNDEKSTLTPTILTTTPLENKWSMNTRRPSSFPQTTPWKQLFIYWVFFLVAQIKTYSFSGKQIFASQHIRDL